jgi:glycogen debranching enzyme
LRFLILGEHEAGVDTARGRFHTILGKATESLARKETLYRDRILGGVQFDCSDKSMNDAFYCAKANVLLSVMDLRPHYPAPFLAAGFPIYTWLFGCDSCYSTAGVASGGFSEAAGGTLDCLLHYAGQKKQGAHEVASNGRLLGWDHIQETPQLVLACWKHFQWTGDMSFLKKAYPVCKESIAHALVTADRDKDGYLEGPGLMEQAGMGPERIDSVCYLYAASESLAKMAEALRDSGAEDYRRHAAELKKNFNRDWWNREQKMWACSLLEDHKQTMDDFWAVCFPQEVGIADMDRASIALDRIQNEWVNDKWGFVAQRKPNIAGEGVGVVHNNILALTAFTFGKADLGWKLMKLAAQAPLQERMLGAFDETMPGGGDLIQLWSFGPFLEAIIGGLAGVHPVASEHKVEIYPQLPRDLKYFALHGLRFGGHELDVDWKRAGEINAITFTHTKGSADLQVLFRIAMTEKSQMKLDGKVIAPERELLRGVVTGKVELSLRPGNSATVLLEPGQQ